MDYNDSVNVKTGILMASMYVSLCEVVLCVCTQQVSVVVVHVGNSYVCK